MTKRQRLDRRYARGGTGRSTAVFLWMVLVVCLAAKTGPTWARAGLIPREVVHIRHFTAPQHTRIVLDMSGPGSFEVRRVRHPDRVAINVHGAHLRVDEPIEISDGLVQAVRTNQGAARAQVVVDLCQRSEFRSFSLPGGNGHYDRIVVDILRPGVLGTVDSTATTADTPGAPPFVVVIDPGHGGMDPGATRDGLDEKAVVMDIAREVARLLNTLPGYQAVLTRRGDYGLELWERVDFARRNKGDLFLSVHCNTHPRAEVDGMEVYFLSLQGATDREAGELADAENAAQLVGLDPRRKHDELVKNILMDMKMTQVLKESGRLSHHILDAGRASGVVDGRKVKQAGFQVLRSLAMPSALVEVAYMSNEKDLMLLRSRQGQRDLAAVLVQGIVSWRRDEPAVMRLAGSGGSRWSGRYRVRRGDSLWGLARRHGTTVTEISRYNKLETGAINVGQMLRLPETGQEP